MINDLINNHKGDTMKKRKLCHYCRNELSEKEIKNGDIICYKCLVIEKLLTRTLKKEQSFLKGEKV